MTAKTLICETDHVIAIEQDLGGEAVVVAFNDMALTRDGLHFWADDFLLKHGFSAIGIVTAAPNWYPAQAMDQVIAAVLPRIGRRKVITFGQGHGGYGALKFSSRLQTSVALSVSPQWSIDPADVGPFDSRFAKYFKDFLANGHRIEQEDICSCGFVVFDSLQSLSSAHAEKLAQLAGIQTIPAPFFMREGGLAAEGRTVAALINLCARTSSPPQAIELRELVRAGRNASKAYLNGMLRQLILRVSDSSHHSAVFASILLGKGSDEGKLFYASLISHAKCDSATALSQLRDSTTHSLETRHLLPLWQIARKLRFPEAELAVAHEIRARLATNTWACLCAVNTLIRAGDVETARQELTRLTKNADALDYIKRFIEHSLELQKPQILEEFLTDRLPEAPRTTVLFALANGYQTTGARKSAFEKLMQLQQICADSPENLRKIAALFVELGEFSTALDIRKQLLRNAPNDYLLALEIVDVKVRNALAKDRKRIRVELKKIHTELAAIMQRPHLPSIAWERASHLYEAVDDVSASLRAMRRAVSSPERSFEAAQRFATLLARKGRKRAARQELEKLFAQNAQDPKRLRQLCGPALWLHDHRLARRVAEAQFRLEPDSAESSLVLARQLRLIGDRNRARELLSALIERERRSPFISNLQWVRLAQELYEAGDATLAQEALVEATAREPNNPDLRKLLATHALAQKLGRPISLEATQEDQPKTIRIGFFSRLRKIFTR